MTPASTDRNLLFGILALQMDFIKRDALVKAMNAWVLEKAKSLGQILVEQKALATERHALLEALVQEHLKQHGNDPEQSLAAVSSVASVRQELQQIADPDLQASLAHVSAARHDDAGSWATRAPSVGTSTSSGLRFRILRPHAEGGLGKVSVARDEELHREVALKEIKDRHADDLDSRSRFVQEAEITGGLEHPGIVPVYGLGQYADGRPFYAMRFIRGDSLKEAIERFHKAEGPKRDPGERSLELRKLLGRFLDVCNAIGYAHSRGVLHRDLKPGNIMLGQYGETLVVDWGLAKPVDQPERSADSPEGLLKPASSSGSAPTQMGSAIGTPQYMSPEQAAGRLDLLGPASDVYSLGATLYCLLTGQPPVSDPDQGAVLQKVQRGDFPKPRQVKATVPAALEAICLKALALKPDDRYASPRELADDVEHWLADEPVAAYREPWPARAGRWARRHRTGVTAAVAALFVAVVGLVTATVLLTAANERERTAKALAETNEVKANQQRDKARERFQLARDAVDKFHTQVSESPEMKAEGVEKLRTKLLESAVEFYEKLAKEEEGSDPKVQAERANTFWRLAMLCSDVGRHEQAEEAFQTALAIYENLAADHPTITEYQNNLARSHNSLGKLYSHTGRNAAAEKSYQDALAIRQKLAADHPTVTEYQNELAGSYNSLGILYSATGRNADAEKVYQAVLAIQQKVAADHPTVTEYQSNLAGCHNNLGLLYGATGRHADAEKAYQAALAIRQKLAADHPTVSAYQNALASNHYNLGLLYRATGRNADAETAYLAALAIFKKLAADHPTVTDYQNALARSHNNLGNLHRATGRNADAEKAYQAALAIQQKFAADHPTITDYQSDLAGSHNDLGNLHRDTGRNGDAERAFQAALAIQQKLAADHPSVTAYQNNLAGSHNNLGNLHRDTGRNVDAESACLAALAIFKKLAADHPSFPKYQNNLASSHNDLGNLYSATGRSADAETAYLAALAIFKKLAADHPSVTEYQKHLAGSHYSLGNLYSATGRNADAETAYLSAVAIQKKLAADHPSVTAYQNDLASSHNNLGLLYRATSRNADAETAHLAALAIQKNLAADPDHPVTKYQNNLAGIHYNLWLLYSATGRNADAEKAYQAAVAIWQKLAADHPTITEYHIDLARIYGNLGRMYNDTGRNAEAETTYQAALAIYKKLAADHPTITGYHIDLARTHGTLGLLYSTMARHAEAEKSYEAALDIQKKLAGKPAAVPALGADLGVTFLWMANLFRDTDRAEKALEHYKQSIDVLKDFLQKDKQHSTTRMNLHDAYSGRAWALGTLGRHTEAVHDWDRAIELDTGQYRVFYRIRRALSLAAAGEHALAMAAADEVAKEKSPPAAMLYDLACLCSLASTAARQDAKVLVADRTKMAEEYSARAVEFLAKAAAAGYFKDPKNLEHMKKDTDLDPLRNRPEFKKLLADLK